MEFMDRIMGRDIEEKRRWEVERGEEWKSAANMKGWRSRMEWRSLGVEWCL
jgi:hypothetical protein